MKTSLSFPFSLQKLKSVFTASYLYFRHNNLVDSFSLANCERSAMRLVRFILLVFTSAFYLVGPPDNSFHIKLVVVLAMVVASVLAHNLYETWHLKSQQIANNARTVEQEDKVRSNLLKIVFAEIVGISLLIIPTGGLDSPFAWYALNPIIMAAYFAPGFYSWAVLGLFLSLTCGVSQLYPGHGTYFAFLPFWLIT